MESNQGAFDRNLVGSAVGQQPADDPSLDATAFVRETIATATGIAGVTGAALMLADEAHVLRYAASTDRVGRLLERSQEQAEEGPCMQAYVLDAPVGAADVTADQRWPGLAALLASSPLRAVLAVPVHAGGGPVGTLTAYADHAHQWDQEQTAALTGLAAALDRLLASNLARHRSDRLAEQLQQALDYRAGIERAVGFLMGRDRVDAVTAFNQLRAAARSNRRRVADVAHDLLHGQPLPAIRVHTDRPSHRST